MLRSYLKKNNMQSTLKKFFVVSVDFSCNFCWRENSMEKWFKKETVMVGKCGVNMKQIAVHKSKLCL